MYQRYPIKLIWITAFIVIFCITLLVIPPFLRHDPHNNYGLVHAYYLNGTHIPGYEANTYNNFDELLNITFHTWNPNTKINIWLDPVPIIKDNNYTNVHYYNISSFVILAFVLVFICTQFITDNKVEQILIYLCVILIFAVVMINYSTTTTDAGMKVFFNQVRYDIAGTAYLGNESRIFPFDNQFEMIDTLIFLTNFNDEYHIYFKFSKYEKINPPGTSRIVNIILIAIILFVEGIVWTIKLSCRNEEPEAQPLYEYH